MKTNVTRVFLLALAASLTLSGLLFFLWTWHWPLVGDASLIHYIAFLITRGWTPYAQLGDMNMPGSYLIELAAMRIFGMGDLAWRLYDFTIILTAAAAFFLVGRPVSEVPNVGEASVKSSKRASWSVLPAVFSASLFALIHGRDGLAEGGQRDLAMAVCLLLATAFLFLVVRRRTPWPAALFGLLSGIAVTIKPTSFPLTLIQLALAVHALRTDVPQRPGVLSHTGNPRLLPIQSIVAASAGYLLAPAAALVFLLREHALPAFLAGFRGIVPYYASLGHRPIAFVLLHSLSPILPLVLAWFAVVALKFPTTGSRTGWERHALIAGVLFGLANCLLQQRALPYYRYPLLAFLLPLIALDLTRAIAPNDRPGALSMTGQSSRVGSQSVARSIAILALGYASFVLAPQSAILIHRYRWRETDFISTLQQSLTTLGGPALSGRIQCIDSISGCNNVLYRMRLEPATGVLSDFLLFGATTDKQPTEQIPILRDTRAQFISAILARPPKVIVVTSHLHIDGPDDFAKLDRWPAFSSLLAARYILRTEWSPSRTARWWSREETPASYRIYILRTNTSAPTESAAAGLPQSDRDERELVPNP